MFKDFIERMIDDRMGFDEPGEDSAETTPPQTPAAATEGVSPIDTPQQHAPTMDEWRDQKKLASASFWVNVGINAFFLINGTLTAAWGVVVTLGAFSAETVTAAHWVLALIVGAVCAFMFDGSLQLWLRGWIRPDSNSTQQTISLISVVISFCSSLFASIIVGSLFLEWLGIGSDVGGIFNMGTMVNLLLCMLAYDMIAAFVYLVSSPAMRRQRVMAKSESRMIDVDLQNQQYVAENAAAHVDQLIGPYLPQLRDEKARIMVNRFLSRSRFGTFTALPPTRRQPAQLSAPLPAQVDPQMAMMLELFRNAQSNAVRHDSVIDQPLVIPTAETEQPQPGGAAPASFHRDGGNGPTLDGDGGGESAESGGG